MKRKKSIAGPKSSSKKKDNTNKRTRYSVKDKLKILEFAEKYGRPNAISKYNITSGMLAKWFKVKDEIAAAVADETTWKKSLHSGPRTANEQLEDAVYSWFLEMRTKGLKVSQDLLIAKACNVDKAWLEKDRSVLLNWVKRFCRKKSIVLRHKNKLVKKNPDVLRQLTEAFDAYVDRQIKTYPDLTEWNWANADQTALFFNDVGNTTLESAGAKEVHLASAGSEKTRVTVMLGAFLEGTMLRPMAVFKGKDTDRGRIREEFKHPVANGYPPNSKIKLVVQESAWFDLTVMNNWVDNVWGNRPGALLRKRNRLILDSFECHRNAMILRKLKEEHNTEVVMIPGGLTSDRQWMDQEVNRQFKKFFRRRYQAWLAEALSEYETGKSKLKQPTRQQISWWIVESVAEITKNAVHASIKKCKFPADLAPQTDDDDDDATIGDVDNDPLFKVPEEYRDYNDPQADFEQLTEVFKDIVIGPSESESQSDSDAPINDPSEY